MIIFSANKPRKLLPHGAHSTHASNPVFLANVDTEVLIFAVCFSFAAESERQVRSIPTVFCFRGRIAGVRLRRREAATWKVRSRIIFNANNNVRDVFNFVISGRHLRRRASGVAASVKLTAVNQTGRAWSGYSPLLMFQLKPVLKVGQTIPPCKCAKNTIFNLKNYTLFVVLKPIFSSVFVKSYTVWFTKNSTWKKFPGSCHRNKRDPVYVPQGSFHYWHVHMLQLCTLICSLHKFRSPQMCTFPCLWLFFRF